MDWGKFFAMGGYGVYVWSAYLAALIILVANVVAPLRDKIRTTKRVRLVARTRATAARSAQRKSPVKRKKKNEDAA